MCDFNNLSLNDLEQKDIRRVMSEKLPFEGLLGRTVLITGASGLIGSNLIKFLMAYGVAHQRPIHVIGVCRSPQKADMVFGKLLHHPNLSMVYQDITQMLTIEQPIDYIIHGASVTASKRFVEQPVETISTAMRGTENILALAREKKVSGMLFLSSLEVYGVRQEQSGKVSEKDYGYLDPLQIRSSYSEGKRMAECLCTAYGSEYRVPVSIARLGQTFGCGVEYQDTRVFAEFARCAIEGKDIVLHTEGKTVRNYCYTMDAVTAIVYILLFGKRMDAYNVANEKTEVSIYEMAEQIADLSDKKIGIRIELADTAQYGYNPVARTVLDVSKLEKLGWHPCFSFQEMLQNLIQNMKLQFDCAKKLEQKL